jgi:hypothetical protein
LGELLKRDLGYAGDNKGVNRDSPVKKVSGPY